VKKTDYDVIGAEVHRKALENLTKEMALTLSRTSGSAVVTEAKDFSCALLDAAGDQLAYSGFITIHIASSLLGVQETIARHDLGDVRPGDAFICNDPHSAGAQHQADVGIISPFFYGEELVGWGYSNQHVVDIGGMSISGMAPSARDVYSEALLFPSIRAVRGGTLDPEWERYIANSVRSPGPVLNDLRSMIAANNVGQRQIAHLIDSYGMDQFLQFSELNKGLSEQALRRRIAKLPDGVYEAHDWCEYDGHGPAEVFHVEVAMTVSDDELRFDFASEEPQVDAFINGTKASVWGQTMTALLVQFAYDIPVNAGVWRPLTIDVGEPGTIVNSIPPAPVSCSHMETGMRICKLVSDVLSQACAASDDEELRGRVAGQGANGFAGISLWGLDQYDNEDVVLFMDACVGIGGGAQTTADGMDGYGCTCMLGCGLPAVEIHESQHALVFLWRRIDENSGGPGWRRGGHGLNYAFAAMRRMIGPLYNSVAEVPPRGFAGGLPGAAAGAYAVRDTNVLELLGTGVYPTEELLAGSRVEYRAKEGYIELLEGDVLVTLGAGGGGLGDPLGRDPELVARDVRDGYVSADHAELAYGVALGSRGELDGERTAALRTHVREQRIGRDPSRAPGTEPGASGTELTPSGWSCRACGEHLGAAADDWRADVKTVERPLAERLAELGMRVRGRVDDPVLLLERVCPSCATLLSVDVEVGSARLRSPRVQVVTTAGPVAEA
jgi:N-methylhydantoinase B